MSLDQAADASGESANDEGADRSSNEDSCFQESFANSRHASIMMVDSEPIMLDAVQSFLEIAGYRNFVKVEEAAEALENIRQHRPDVLLLDVTMPDMDGLEILGRLRENGEFTHLPVIVLASSSHTATKLQALDLGATDFLSKPIDPVEIAVRVRNTLAVRAYQDQMDWLTGLPNRSLFYDRVDWAIARARRERTKLALLHITFDDFQTVIDAFGRKVGDDVLKQLVKRLSSKFRASDAITRNAADGEGLADFFRLDKAAFSVLLPLVENVASAALVGQRVLAAMSEPLNLDGTEVHLTPSIGIAGFPEDADDAGALIKLASGACSLSAAQGGERLRFHSSTMNQDYQQWLRMEKDLRRAADNGELSLLYQPKIDVSSGLIVGAEALMRWSRPDGIFVSPSDFISVAKETGIILPIGEWSLREACRQAVQWRDQGAEIKIAVNISAPQFFGAKLAQKVQSVLEEAELTPGLLTLEITESVVIDRPKQALAVLADLHSIGVGVSIDDFGTGYSSMSYLKHFQVDEVKIDKTLIADVVTSHKDRALVKAITYISHQFGSSVCAVGVEDTNQLAFLQKIRCDQYQGYLFNRPVDPNTIVTQYRERQGETPPSNQ